MEHYQELLNHEREEQTKKAVEVQLEPIYKELEEIRKRIFSLPPVPESKLNEDPESY